MAGIETIKCTMVPTRCPTEAIQQVRAWRMQTTSFQHVRHGKLIALFDLACPDLHSASDVVIDRGRASGLVICSLIGTCLTETGMSSRCLS
ncbi:hypothetical protein FB007_12245 [Sinorhizobium medicae]|nr:hypothetical protein FB007_12245 [Sinorhizobium medicae]